MAVIPMKALLESGVHFGHRTNKWDPRMKPYIFTERNGIHIIDLQQTSKLLNHAFNVIRDVASNGGNVLFVGTKRQAQETVAEEAARCGMPYVTERWMGGMLTNWSTMHARIEELDRLEKMRDNNLIFIVDVGREEAAVHEANLLNIPIVAMVDTNCNPLNIDYVIPSNDDAIRAIKLLVAKVADAILEGKALRKEEEGEEKPVEETRARTDKSARRAPKVVEVDEELQDDALLGEATLAKMSAAREDAVAVETPATPATPAVEKTEDTTPAAPEESGTKDAE